MLTYYNVIVITTFLTNCTKFKREKGKINNESIVTVKLIIAAQLMEIIALALPIFLFFLEK